MDLNANDKLLLKQIVTQLARSVRDIQQRLHGRQDGIWLIRDLKHTIERDILKNPNLPDLINKVKSGVEPLVNLTSTEKYAKSLLDMVTPAPKATNYDAKILHRKPRRRRDKSSHAEPDPKMVDKELREYYGIKSSMPDHLAKVEEHWGKAKSEDWAYRYRCVYEALYKLLPKWKRDVVDAEPEDRITNELAKDVLSTAQDFALYRKLIKTLPDDSEIKAKLTEQLLSTEYEPK